ncbi:unnamed protein product [Moneuplotes crassus]|uniref:Uncharacterized protein n=1 Tax=Euplotes crassus TaxID=5936 RepID=A0AAD1U797_EUPCR|nr:unnamed protein product [Moneuplotes crassus]
MSQRIPQRKAPEYYQGVLKRWEQNPMSGQQHEESFLKLQREFRKYYPNIYILNSKALLIQHAVFGWLSGLRKVTPKFSGSQLSSSQIVFKPKFKLNELSRSSSVKRKVRSKVKSGKFDNKENLCHERSVHISPINCDNPKRMRVTKNKPEDKPQKLSVHPYGIDEGLTKRLILRDSKLNLSNRTTNLGTSLRNITNVIHKTVGKYNGDNLTRMEERKKNNLSMCHKTEYETTTNPFRPSSTLAKPRDDEYERQKKDKEARILRMQEAKRKYSKQKLKKSAWNTSCTESNSHTISKRQSPNDRKGSSVHQKKQMTKSRIIVKDLSPVSRDSKISHTGIDKENYRSFNERTSATGLTNAKMENSLLIIPKMNSSGARLPLTSRVSFKKSTQTNYKLMPSKYCKQRKMLKKLSSSVKAKTQVLSSHLREINKEKLVPKKEEIVLQTAPSLDFSDECPEMDSECTPENPEEMIKICENFKSLRTNPSPIPNYQKTTFSISNKRTQKRNFNYSNYYSSCSKNTDLAPVLTVSALEETDCGNDQDLYWRRESEGDQ